EFRRVLFRSLQLLDRGDGAADRADHHRHFAALLEHVHAEAVAVRRGDGHVHFQLALEGGHLALVHQRVGDLLDHALGQPGVAERVHPALDLDVDRRAGGQEHVRRVLFHHQLEEIADIHAAAPVFRAAVAGGALAGENRALSHSRMAPMNPPSFAHFTRAGLLTASLSALLLAACATLPPPTQELAEAQQAVARAGVADSARAELARAQAAMAAGDEDVARSAALAAAAGGDLAAALSRQQVLEQDLAQRRLEIDRLRAHLGLVGEADGLVAVPPPAAD